MKTFKRILALVLTVLMLMPMMTVWVSRAAISGGLDGETSRTVKTLYPGVTSTNIKTSSSSKYDLQNINVIEFNPKQADLYVDVTNEKTYANNTQTTLNTVKAFNTNNDQGKTAIAAVNGDLWMTSTFSVATTTVTLPRGFNVYNGEIITSAHMPQEEPYQGEFWSFGMTEDHVPMIGCPELDIQIRNTTKNSSTEADGLNRLPANNALVVYTDKGCLNNYAASDAYEVVIDVSSDYTVKHGASITGKVTGIYSSSAASNPQMQANRIILTARGTRTMLLTGFSVGDSVTLNFSVTERYNRNTQGWQNVQNAVGGHMPFVVDGVKWETGTTTNYSTTIVGIKNDGNVVFIANDGRQSSFSTGLDFNDYWDFADDMDLNTAFILDGGGSTTLVELTDAGYAVTNSPSDGSQRSVVNSVILSAGPVDTNRGTYEVKYPSDNIDLTNLNFATDDAFMLLGNFAETKLEKTVQGVKMTVKDFYQGPSFSISYGLPNTTTPNPNSVLADKSYDKINASDYPYLVLNMAVVSADSSAVQFQALYTTAGSAKGINADRFVGFNNALNNVGFNKYDLNPGSNAQYKGTLNTFHLVYLYPANGVTATDGDYIILHSARLAKTAEEAAAMTDVASIQTVTLNPNGGECDQGYKYAENGKKYGVFPIPTREGYEFTGWYTAASGGKEITENSTVNTTAARTLYAQWTEKEPEPEYFYINFDPNGGTGLSVNYPILSGQTYESAIEAVRGLGMPDIPAKSGYTFDGWYCEETGYTLKLSDSFTADKNLTFKAVWKEYNGAGLIQEPISGLPDQTAMFTRLAELHVDLTGGSFNKDSGVTVGSVSASSLGLDDTDTEFDIYVYHATSTPTDTNFNNLYFGVIYKDGAAKSVFYSLGDLLDVILRSCSLDDTTPDTLSFIGMKDFTTDELTGTENWMDKDLLNGSSYDVTLACKNYTLTLDPAGGTMPEGYKTSYIFKGGNQRFDAVIGGFPIPTRDGYEFTGWRWLEHSSMCWESGWGTQPFTFGRSITVTALWSRLPEEGPAAELGEDEDGKHIYVDGVIMTDGLYEVDGDYYYAYRDGSLASDVKLFTYNNQTDLVSSYRYFAEDCKMDKDGWLTLDDDSGRAYYFNSAFHATGARYIDGSYYFFMKNSGEMVRNNTMFIPEDNSAGLKAGVYTFGSDGKMTTAPVKAAAVAETVTLTTTEPVSGLDIYVQSTEVLAVNTTAPVVLPEAQEDDGDDSDE